MKKMFKKTLNFILSSILLIAGVSFAENKPIAVTTERPGEWWYTRHEEKLKEVKKGDVDVVLIGDSITHYWERSPSYGYYFGERKVLNLGFGGDKTQNVLWRIKEGQLDGLSPKVISLLIGTNNSNNHTAQDTLLGIEKILSVLKEKCPKSKILLTSILPRSDKKLDGVNKQVNRKLPKFADNKTVFYIDLYQSFLKENGEMNMDYYWRDGVHLIEQGYAKWGGAMEPYISKLLGEEALASNPPNAVMSMPQNGARHKQKLEEVKQGDFELVFIGDSITHYFDRPGNFGASVWEKYYKHRKAFNLGFGGNQTQKVIWRLQNGQIKGLNPKLCVLMIGTNNTAIGKHSAKETFLGIKHILYILKRRLPNSKVLVLSIFPRGLDENDPFRIINEKVNAMLPTLADQKNIFHLDINKSFLDENGKLSHGVMPDLLHPNTKGYQIWARAMEPIISRLLNDKQVQ